jgi:hypothetical protein
MSNNFPTNKHEWLAPTYNFLRALWAWISGSPNVDFWQADAYVASNVAATYANGTVGVGATLTKATAGAFPTVDGVVAKLGNVYLLGGQTTKYQNGLYQLTTLGSTSTAFVLTRVSGFDVAADFTITPASPVVFVRLGATTYGGTVWEYTGGASPTMGSTSLTFAQAQIQRESRQEWDPCKVLDATVLNLTDYTYTAATQILTANATGALGTMDGQAMAVGDRAVRNVGDLRDGIYSITNLGGGSDYAVFTRAADANTSAEFTDGKIVSIARGSVYGGTLYECNVSSTFTLDTDTPTWTKTAVGVTFASVQTALNAASGTVGLNGQALTNAASVAIYNAAKTFKSTITSLASQARSVVFPDGAGNVMLDAMAASVSALYSFGAATLKQMNGAGTFGHTLASLATSNQTITLPDVAGTVAIVGQNMVRSKVTGAASDAAGAATKYLTSPGGVHAAAQVKLCVIGATGVLQNLNASLGTAPGGADTYAVTVQKSSDNGSNWVDTTLTCTISAAGKSASDVTHLPAVAAGDLIAIKVISSGVTAAAACVSCEFC